MNEIVVLAVAIVAAIVGYRFAAKKQQARSLDGYSIKKLEASGMDTNKEHQLEFWFYSDKKQAIEGLASELEKDLFEVHISDTEQDPKYVLRAIKSMVPGLQKLQALRKQFNRLAKQYGAD